MTAADGRWSDLRLRIGSAIVLIVIGLAAAIAGGFALQGFVAVLCGAMVWEAARMLSPEQSMLALGLGLLCAGSMLALKVVANPGLLPLVLVPAAIGAALIARQKPIFGACIACFLLAGWELVMLRTEAGLGGLLWLVLIVMASDVMGYFAGRLLGGPKFWPKVSPKKTWSGTIAGWLGAACVGLGFVIWGGASFAIVPISVAGAFAAQMGDIAESAIKRMVGVKDSSRLIPGHGGVMDRFDGMIGASIFVLALSLIFGIPLERG